MQDGSGQGDLGIGGFSLVERNQKKKKEEKEVKDESNMTITFRNIAPKIHSTFTHRICLVNSKFVAFPFEFEL